MSIVNKRGGETGLDLTHDSEKIWMCGSSIDPLAKRKKRNRERIMLDFYRMPAKDLIRVVDVGLMSGKMKLRSNPIRICKHRNSFSKHKHYATV
jgi:hypothetical protein